MAAFPDPDLIPFKFTGKLLKHVVKPFFPGGDYKLDHVRKKKKSSASIEPAGLGYFIQQIINTHLSESVLVIMSRATVPDSVIPGQAKRAHSRTARC